jgi:hypothetical protein
MPDMGPDGPDLDSVFLDENPDMPAESPEFDPQLDVEQRKPPTESSMGPTTQSQDQLHLLAALLFANLGGNVTVQETPWVGFRLGIISISLWARWKRIEPRHL